MIEGDVFYLIFQLFIFIKNYKFEDIIRNIIYTLQKKRNLICNYFKQTILI